jgi:hypothetical protein
MNAAFSFFAEVAVRSSAVFCLTLLAAGLMRNHPAAKRHLVCLAGLLVALLLPAGLLALPKVGLLPQRETEEGVQRVVVEWLGASDHGGVGEPDAEPRPAAADGAGHEFDLRAAGEAGLLALILAGMVVQLARLGVSAVALRRSSRGAMPLDGADAAAREAARLLGLRHCPPVVISRSVRVPMLAGCVRPVVMLPAGAFGWPSDRLAMVLCHELAHVKRRDAWWNPVIGLTMALYWWNPLAWLTARLLRRERERACDDLVLRARFRATDYAETLIEVVRAGVAQSAALAMASTSRIEGRVRAILDPRRRRAPAGIGALCVVVVVAGGFLWLASAAEALNPADLSALGGEDSETLTSSEPTAGKASVQIEIGSRFVEMNGPAHEENRELIDLLIETGDETAIEALLRSLHQTEGVDFLSAPTVTMKPGGKATIAVTREFRYPVEFEKSPGMEVYTPTQFEARNIGVEVEVTPKVNGGLILLNALLRVTDFKGFTTSEQGVNMPVFETREARLVRTLGDGETAATFLPGGRVDRQVVETEIAGSSEKIVEEQELKRRALVLLTARLVEGTEREPGTDESSSPPQVAGDGPRGPLPYGAAVPGKPGFATSPYALDSGYVDLRGWDPGMEVKCPYTGKLFLVP